MEAISELPTWQVTASLVALALIDFMQQWEAPCFVPRDSTSRIRGYGGGRTEAVWCLHYSKEKSQICWTLVLLPQLPLASAPETWGCQVSWPISAILAIGAIEKEKERKRKKKRKKKKDWRNYRSDEV